MKRTPPTIRIPGSLPEIDSMGISFWDQIHSLREHTGPCWEVVHVVGGAVRLHMNDEIFRGGPGDTLLIPAQTPHRDEFRTDTGFKVLHIMFLWNEALAFFPRRLNRDLEKLPLVNKQAIRAAAFETYDCFKDQRPLWREMTRACLYRLLLLIRSAVIERHLPSQANELAAAKARHRLMIQNAKEFIRANLKKPITLSDIAGHLGISACHLSHLFSEQSGFTLSSFLINSRMDTAVQLLAKPQMRVSEVAYAVGFEDPNYFCKVFRRHYGCSPGRYRIRKPMGAD